MLTGTKPASHSLGVWGGAVAAIAGLGGLVGYTITPDDAAQMGQQADQVAAGIGQVVQAVSALVGMLAGLAALIGRLRADARIGAPAPTSASTPDQGG